ncbi:hypothetical protein Poly30_33510 [Planctomycetes bacterium Poly30]|uniref:DUF2231 domain-containing protein n=1 Tax=Saltatorellus ferox TaxID=2528018 RepID=A0A518EUT6_9BACT|nr:hypothetical protein Poly30_33510 [Planctomycetes bacterium Poly30]
MFDFVDHIWSDLHPILSHFPIALLFFGGALAVASRRWPDLTRFAVLVLVTGAVSTLPSVISGLVAHFPYEESSLHGAVEQHQLLAFGTTLLFLILGTWAWRTRHKPVPGVSTGPFLAVLAVGLILLTVVGGTGGELVYGHGIGVRGVNPLLDATQP